MSKQHDNRTFTGLSNEDRLLLDRLRAGDEAAFLALVNQYHTFLTRMARVYLTDHRIIEEIVQETWIGVLRGLARFEGRSSLKTWVCTILMNKAKTFAQREMRHAALPLIDDDDTEPPVSADRFRPSTDPDLPGEWLQNPRSWNDIPEEQLLSKETRNIIQQAIDALPSNQREVITLRDIQQISSEEVCNILGITETNQRVLLHRARAKVRTALEQYFGQ